MKKGVLGQGKAARLLLIIGVAGVGVVTALTQLGYEVRVVETRYENGDDKEVWVYRRNLLGGQEKVKEFIFFESGHKECEVDYKDGRVNGWGRMWYESGQLRLECPYRNSEPHGVRRAYHENGLQFCRAEYEDGRMLRRQNWDEEGNEIDLDMDRPDPF